MKKGDGISRRLGAKLGHLPGLFILTKFHRLVYLEKWRKKEEKVTLPEPESNQRPLEYRNANHYTRKLFNHLATEIGMRSVVCTLRGKQVHWPKGLSIMSCRCVGDRRYNSAFLTSTLNKCGWQRPL